MAPIQRIQIPKRDEWLDRDGKFSLAGLQALGRLSDIYSLYESIIIEEWSWFIEFPDDKDYKVIVDAKVARTIDEITTISTTGTCTLTGEIDGVALGGTANSVSTTEQTQAHTSANAVAVGADFTLAISANSACENLSVTVKTTRTL